MRGWEAGRGIFRSGTQRRAQAEKASEAKKYGHVRMLYTQPRGPQKMRGKEAGRGIFWGGTQKCAKSEKGGSVETHLQDVAHFWVVAGIGFEPMTSGL